VAVLHKLADLLTERLEEFASAITLEMGKLIDQSRGEMALCADIARYYADNAAALLKPIPYKTSQGEAWVEHHPIGVLVAVEPWNFPIYQLVRVIAPAIAVGNSVLLKHSEIVPKCAELFEAVVRDAGAPAGVLTNLYISPEQVAGLIGDDRVQGVALTGSERAGSAVAAIASEKLKKATLELGGNDAFIVLDDADIAKAAEVGADARLSNAGQVCTAAKRFILHEAIADQFLQAFSAHLKGVTLGDPRDSTTTLGPLSSRKARDMLAKQVDSAVSNGAKVVLGGKPAQGEGFFFEPTILTNIERKNPAYFEEFFGPVAQIYVVKNDDEVVALANDSHFGLGGSIFAGDVARARKLASRIETGMVWINAATGSVAELPFGGIKHSGFGRELGDVGIMEFVNKKLVVTAAA
jgi:succinate-semialdehyde dehydrogenase/glutarate-semialdehyde dehydrogenase